MHVTLTAERPDTPDAIALIDELQTYLESFYAPEHRHGCSVQQLIDAGVDFFVLRVDGAAAGCIGLLCLSAYAEIKRMYIRPAYRRHKLGVKLLEHVEHVAQERRIPLLRLETGIHQPEANARYESFGFRLIPAFGPYQDDGVSLCYEKSVPQA